MHKRELIEKTWKREVEAKLKKEYGIDIPIPRGAWIIKGKNLKKYWNDHETDLDLDKVEDEKHYYWIQTRTGAGNEMFFWGDKGWKLLKKHAITNAKDKFDATYVDWILEVKENG